MAKKKPAAMPIGSYSEFTCKMPRKAVALFKEATKELYGVRYEPVAFSQQLVAGRNIKFFCNSQTISNFPLLGTAIVTIYVTLKGKPIVTKIDSINS